MLKFGSFSAAGPVIDDLPDFLDEPWLEQATILDEKPVEPTKPLPLAASTSWDTDDSDADAEGESDDEEDVLHTFAMSSPLKTHVVASE
jgi:hypothetical protein